MKPVTLVATVVARNTAVHPCGVLAFHIWNTTTAPAKTPIRLKMTCKAVKAATDIPRTMISPPRAQRLQLVSASGSALTSGPARGHEHKLPGGARPADVRKVALYLSRLIRPANLI